MILFRDRQGYRCEYCLVTTDAGCYKRIPFVCQIFPHAVRIFLLQSLLLIGLFRKLFHFLIMSSSLLNHVSFKQIIIVEIVVNKFPAMLSNVDV